MNAFTKSDMQRSDLLDIIKGVMILFVIITHYQWIYPDDYLKYGFVFYIDMAVPCFMIISGYLAAISFEKKGIYTVKDALSIQNVLPKYIRFLVPYFIVFVIELFFMIFYKKLDIVSIIENLFRGGVEGYGSYYIPILMQFIVIVPFIVYIIKKYDFSGVCICFIFTAMYELVAYSWGVNERTYALLIFRYVSIIAFGCYIAISRANLNGIVLSTMFIIGITWQWALNYIPLDPPFMNHSWARVNYLSSLFVMPIMYILIRKFHSIKIKLPILQGIGKASYHIMLTQMFFYCYGAGVIFKFISGTIPQLIICCVVCCTFGYVFYLIEKRITTYILGFVNSHNYFIKSAYSVIKFINNVAQYRR